MLSKRIRKENIEEIITEFKSESTCIDPILERLFRGEYQYRGKKGRVIIKGDQAIKINEEIGNISYENNIEMSSFYLQNVLLVLIHRSLPEHLKNHIIKCIKFFGCDKGGISIYEYCNRGTLMDVIDAYISENRYKELNDLLYKCIVDIHEILEALDKYGFVHNDLKMTNVLVNEEILESGPEFTFKLSDLDNSFIKISGIYQSIHKKSKLSKLIPKPTYSYVKDSKFIINHTIGGDEINCIRYRQYLGPKQNIDLYTLLLSIIFYEPITQNLNKLPSLSKIANIMFSENDIAKIIAEISSSYNYSKRICKFVSFLIVKAIEIKQVSDIVF